jgi:hypothetical protein
MAQYEHLPVYKKAMDIAIYIENILGASTVGGYFYSQKIPSLRNLAF